ncbi:hypothetical protein PQX77_002829 [Marasmius sp. AFHP31]|nr:hypothetical protein PQX77_002829 [Marasmius sp. AFHP31]
MESPERNSARKKVNNREEGVENELVASVSTQDPNEHKKENNQDASATPHIEVYMEPEVDNDEDEEERDPNDIVDKRVITATPALKQQFQALFNKTHFPDQKAIEWKKTHRDNKCERCTALGLPCTSNPGERELVCHECHRTSARKCSRVDDFRKVFVMEKMGIDEGLWKVLKEAYLEEKSRTTIQKGMEKTHRMEEAEEQGTEEEDELDCDYEVAPQETATSTKRDVKQKRIIADDGGPISSSIPNSSPAKKGKRLQHIPEVVIDKRIIKKILGGGRENSKAATSSSRNVGRIQPDFTYVYTSQKVRSSAFSIRTNTHRVKRVTSDISGINEPANTSDVVDGSKRHRRPTRQALNAEAEHRKRRKVAGNDIIGDLNTHAHDGSAGLPIATAAISTNPAPAGATTSAQTTSPGNAAATNDIYPLPLLPASVSKSTKTKVPSMSAQQTTLPPPKLNQTTPNAVISSPHVPPQGQVEARRLPPPRPIPPELSLSVLKRALEDISSDLRYNRIDIPSVMTQFDDVAERIGRRADLCVVSEPPFPEDQRIVHLKNLPSYILVKLERTCISQLDGLAEGVVPIEPRKQTMRISIQQKKGSPVFRNVQHLQFPLTLAYAFTDYRAQGQTIVPAIIDIATPPGGALNLFNIYVALSRSAGRHSIRLLRKFDSGAILQSHSAELIMEDQRLEHLDAETKASWAVISEQTLVGVSASFKYYLTSIWVHKEREITVGKKSAW